MQIAKLWKATGGKRILTFLARNLIYIFVIYFIFHEI